MLRKSEGVGVVGWRRVEIRVSEVMVIVWRRSLGVRVES